MGLKVTVEKRQAGVYVVYPAGSIDSDTYLELEKSVTPIIDSSPKAVIFNLEGVTYLSSMGFGIIYRTKQAVEKGGGAFVVTNPQPNVKKIFDAVKTFPESLFANMRQADRYLDAFIAKMHRKSTGQKDRGHGSSHDDA